MSGIVGNLLVEWKTLSKILRYSLPISRTLNRYDEATETCSISHMFSRKFIFLTDKFIYQLANDWYNILFVHEICSFPHNL